MTPSQKLAGVVMHYFVDLLKHKAMGGRTLSIEKDVTEINS